MPNGAPYLSKELLHFTNVQINEPSITVITDDALQVVAYLGDATGNGAYSSSDAQRIARVVSGLESVPANGHNGGFSAYPLADPILIGNVNGNGELDTDDAGIVAQQVVGYNESAYMPALPTGVSPVMGGPDPVLDIPAALQGSAGDTIVVPVVLNHSDGLGSLDLALSYDTSRLDVISTADIQPGNLLSEPGTDASGHPWAFDSFTVNLDQADGIIRIGAYRTDGSLQDFGSGNVVLITFHIKSTAPAGAAAVNLLQNYGITTTQLGGNDARGADYLFDLEPRPSNDAGSPLNGSIIIGVNSSAAAEPVAESAAASVACRGRSGAGPGLRGS